ncbi:SDR family oxidoreductase [Pseudorhodoferax sp. Leaf267]|uniref:SDR family oxidoreductase n=1 Tax=Pseudorhodoferax sp. Leaf267 TaxID=1736316 RepID=UPI00191030B1|nr:SDR family NAD(P)-dependent oxidoreductase [Pseudorhodoferax sp. Leaf267]
MDGQRPARPLAGRTVAIAGASRGIGQAMAVLLAEHGASVIGGARAADGPAPPGVRMLALDVTDASSVRAFADAAADAGADSLVHNAGVGFFAPIEHTSVADYHRVMDTNVLGLLLASQCFFPHFRRRHAAGLDSQVVTITSDVSTRTFAHGGLYTASKYAQRALTQALAHEGQPIGLRVTEIRPGMTDTHFNGHVPGTAERALHLQPLDVAQSVLHVLCAPRHVRIDEVVLHPVVQPVVF